MRNRKRKRRRKTLHVTDVDDPTKHNYWPELQKLSKKIAREIGVRDVYILHDDWCALLTGVGEYCDCNPIVKEREGNWSSD